MKNFTNRLETKITTPTTIGILASITFIIFLILGYFFDLIEQAISPLVLFDTSFTGYSYETAVKIIDSLTPNQKFIYSIVIFPLDVLFPFSYTLLFISTFLFLQKKARFIPKLIVYLVPILVFFLDILENVMVQIMLYTSPGKGLVFLASGITQLKWIGILIVVSVLVLVTGIIIFKKMVNK